jgi:nicotinamide-nucleotide amidase
MRRPPRDTDPLEAVADALGEALAARGSTVAVAESLTGGMTVSALARTEGSGDWLQGGVVAYHRSVKHALLGVPPGPVVSEAAATAMATGVSTLLGADLGLALTGVGGPDPQDGEPPGSVWLAVALRQRVTTRHHRYEGEPAQICAAAALDLLTLGLAHLRG